MSNLITINISQETANNITKRSHLITNTDFDIIEVNLLSHAICNQLLGDLTIGRPPAGICNPDGSFEEIVDGKSDT